MAEQALKIIIKEIDRKNYHCFIRISIGKKKARMLLDTGASKTVFDKKKVLKFVKENKIKSVDTLSVGLGTVNVETRMVKLKNVKLGGMKKMSMEVAVLDLSHVNQSYSQLNLPAIDGVFGSDMLMKYKAVISYAKGTITFR